MKFQKEVKTGTILKRYKRFLADIQFPEPEGIVTAHVPNTGSMKTCWEPGQQVLCTYENNPKRKLKYTLQMSYNGKTWIMVNTSLTNSLAQEAIENGTIKELQGYKVLKREVKVGKSRIDILLDYGEDKHCYVEVKNVTLRGIEGQALFPDAVSERGQKHLRELIDLKRKGHRACMLYIVSREDVDRFSPADAIDPVYGRLLREASKSGVEIYAYQGRFSLQQTVVVHRLPVDL